MTAACELRDGILASAEVAHDGGAMTKRKQARKRTKVGTATFTVASARKAVRQVKKVRTAWRVKSGDKGFSVSVTEKYLGHFGVPTGTKRPRTTGTARTKSWHSSNRVKGLRRTPRRRAVKATTGLTS